MEERRFIESGRAKGHLAYASPVIDEWWGVGQRECCRTEVREMRAEFVVQYVFYGQDRNAPWNEWRELEDRPREDLSRPFAFSNLSEAIARADRTFRAERQEVAEMEAERLSEAWELHRADLAYETQVPSWEQEVRMAEAQERAEGRDEPPERNVTEHHKSMDVQTQKPRRRQQSQAPPPHILYRQAGIDRGFQR
jgi:hypothetical protein